MNDLAKYDDLFKRCQEQDFNKLFARIFGKMECVKGGEIFFKNLENIITEMEKEVKR